MPLLQTTPGIALRHPIASATTDRGVEDLLLLPLLLRTPLRKVSNLNG
jgi:hypothetical protein